MKFRYVAFGAALYALSGCVNPTEEVGLLDFTDITPPSPVIKINPNMRSVEFIIDTSRSMNEKVDGTRVILDMYDEHNDRFRNIQAGLLSYSGGQVVETVPFGDFDHAALAGSLDGLKPSGNTPLGTSLAHAESILNRSHGGRYVVALTDGKNTDRINPGSLLGKINEINASTGDAPTNIYIIAFNTDASFQGLVDQGATLYHAADALKLTEILKQVTGEILPEAIGPDAF